MPETTQDCLNELIAVVRITATRATGNDMIDRHWSDISNLFDELVGRIKAGEPMPVATGPIFGDIPRNIGYPGMICGGIPRTELTHIKHVRSAQRDWRYVICTEDIYGNDLTNWVLVEYFPDGSEAQRWKFQKGDNLGL